MKRFLKGFTLAEALITMGVIGVIASMTLPTLSVNVQKQQVGPALAKAINTLETANKLALQDNNARRLDQIEAAKTPVGYIEALRKYINLTVTTEYKKDRMIVINPFKSNNNGPLLDKIAVAAAAYTTSDGITYLPASGLEGHSCFSTQNNYRGHLSGRRTIVFVDVNGLNKGPNAEGKDVFQLFVDASGPVIVMGSSAYKQYSGINDDWTDKCPNNQEPSDASYCGGAIVENGYQVKYKY